MQSTSLAAAVTAAVLWGLAAAPAAAQHPDLSGSWKFNVAQSDYAPITERCLEFAGRRSCGRSVEPRLSAGLHLRIEHARQNPPASLDLDPDAVAASLGERVRE